MINKISPLQGLSTNKSTNATSSSSPAALDFFPTDQKGLNKVDPKEALNKVTPTNKQNPARSTTSTDEAVPEKEEPFKKSLNSAIKEKRNSPAPDSKIGRSGPIDNQDKIETQEPDSVTASPIAVAPMGQFQKTAIVKEPELAEVPQADGEVLAVMKFMKSMEDEFGISAQELVTVMALMSQQVQAQQSQGPAQQAVVSAEDTSQAQLFQKLGLEGGQVKRAEYLYQNMLKEMAQNSMSSYLREQDQQANIQVLSASELRKNDMNRSIDRMNQTFFMNDIRPAYGKAPEINAEQMPMDSQKLKVDNKDEKNDSKLDVIATGGAFEVPQQMEMVEPQQLQVEATAPKLNKEFAKDADKSANEGSPSSGLPLAGLMMQVPSNSAGANTEFDSSSNDSKSSKPSPDTSNLKIKSEAEVPVDASVTSLNTATNKPKIGSDVFALNVPANEVRSNDVRAEDAANVKNIIQGAQVLLRKGGGEMKVQMSPEGLGQVDLKVGVRDGKVDIQIFADTADTKRLLEKGMGDLKSSLAGHRLEVNNVKVDVSQNMERDLTQQQNEQSRDQARQFLGQFRDERDSMRSFGDTPRLRSYKASVASQVAPEPTSVEPSKKNSSRLNVIA